MGIKHNYWGHDLDLSGSRVVICHLTVRLPGVIFYREYIVTKSLYPAFSEIMGTKHIGGMTVTFKGHVTSSVTWPFDSQGPISNRHYIVTKSLSPDVSEILGPKHIGVTTLTFQGHVTSSVTWSFDSQVPISYMRSIVTKSLSPAIFEILASKCIGVTTLKFQGHVTSSVTWPLDSRWSISYWWSVGPNVKGQIERKISKSKNLQNFDLLGALEIRGYESCDFYCKGHILAWIHVDWAILRENRLMCLTYRAVGEKSQRVTRGSHRNDV